MAATTQVREANEERAETCAWPTPESVEATVRRARRAFTEARNTAEDFTADAAQQVRRHPLTAVGLAVTAGAVTGCLLGFAVAWWAKPRV